MTRRTARNFARAGVAAAAWVLVLASSSSSSWFSSCDGPIVCCHALLLLGRLPCHERVSKNALSAACSKRSAVLLHTSKCLEDDSDNDDTTASEGEALAKAFYQQLRERQGQLQSGESTKEEEPTNITDDRSLPATNTRLSEDQIRAQNSRPFSKRKEVSVASSFSNPPAPTPQQQQQQPRKYTGQSDSPLFGNTPRGGANSPPPRQQQQQQSMMEREFQLASRGAGLGIGVQAVFAVVVLLFYIYVGVSGGIVTGGDAALQDDYFGGGDDMLLQYEQVIPVPRDTEKSVWL